MKLFKLALIFISFTSFYAQAMVAIAQVANYSCEAKEARQEGSVLAVEGALRFQYELLNEEARLNQVIGFVSTNYSFNVEANGVDQVISNYTGVFQGDYKNNPQYRPRVYTEHFQFNDFNAAVTSRWDGGGMWGYLVVNKAIGQDKIDAHYVFQAGDHIGGTIDFQCSKVN